MKAKRGSYTVEAAFLMPFMLMITMLVIYTGEWSYNRFALRAAAVSTIIYGCNLQENAEAEAEERFENYAKSYYKELLLGNVSVAVDTTYKKNGQLQVIYEIDMKNPFSGWFDAFGLEYMSHASISESGTALRPCKWIRRVKVIKEILGDE